MKEMPLLLSSIFLGLETEKRQKILISFSLFSIDKQ